MNVLFLDQFSELGGAQRCLLDLLPALACAGWSAHVAAPGDGELAAQAIALRATADRVRCGPYASGHKTPSDLARFAVETPRLACEIRSLIRRYDADLVYVNGPRLLPAAALAAIKGPPILFHAHSLLDGYPLRLAGWSLRLSRAAVVASCRFVGRSLAPYTSQSGQSRIRVVYNGVRQNDSPRLNTSGNRSNIRIGVIGRISPEKGQAEFLRAARLLYPDFPHGKFLICGGPLFSSASALRYSAELESLAEDLPVEFTGWQQDIDSVLSTLDLLVVPSAPIDATPRVILEAFAAGVPVIAFASGGIPEIVEHNVTGFLVEQRSHEALAAAMRQCLREPGRLREVAACARLKAGSEFSLERYRQQMLEAMQSAVAS
jgi:glycosyltransferase involved in cell wall biosynthesis